MKTVNRTFIALFVAIVLFITTFSFSALAYSGSSTFSFAEGKSKFSIGETITVVAKFSSPQKLAGVEGRLVYDDSVEFVSADCTANKITGAVLFSHFDATGNSHLTMTLKFTFKAISAGSCKISFENLEGSTSALEGFSVQGCKDTLTVTNPSATASANANLTSMKVSAGTLTPAFSKDVTTYSVTIPNDVTELLVNVRTEDRKATATVEGSKDMKVGNNKRVLVVTAENGNQKRYTINVTRLDAAGQVPDAPDTTDEPIKTEVVADGQTMYIEENFSPDIIPSGFALNVYIYNGVEVPSITDNNIVMLYLTMPDGSGGGFYVVNKDASFSKMTVITVGGVNYFIMPADEKKIPVGYNKTEITVGEQSVTAYKSEDAKLSDFVLIYAKGPASYTGLYRLDMAEMTIQRAEGIDFAYQNESDQQINSDNIIANINNLSTNGKIVAITIVAIIVLLIAAIIILIVKIATSGKNKEDDKELDDTALLGFDFVTIDDREEK